MKFWLTVLMMPLLLSGCANTGLSRLIAPTVITYSGPQQDKMADEMQGGSCPALNNAMRDYLVIRDQSRAIK